MFRGQIVLQRRQIQKRPLHRTPDVGVSIGPDDGREAGNLQPFGLQIRLLHSFLGRSIDGGQQCLQLLQPLRAGRARVYAGKHQAEVVLQAHADRLIEGKRKNTGHRGLFYDAALVGAAIHVIAGRPGAG